MSHQGTNSILEQAALLRDKADHVADYWDHKRAAEVMRDAADTLERLAPLEPEIEVVRGEE